MKDILTISNKITNPYTCWPRNLILRIYPIDTKQAVFRFKPIIDFCGKNKIKYNKIFKGKKFFSLIFSQEMTKLNIIFHPNWLIKNHELK